MGAAYMYRHTHTHTLTSFNPLPIEDARVAVGKGVCSVLLEARRHSG